MTAQSPPSRGREERWVLVPREPTEEMANAGAHCNSEWLNDGAPIGERMYRDPAMAVWRTMLRTALGEDPNYGWKEPAALPPLPEKGGE